MLKATLVYQWTHRPRGGLMQSRHLEKFQCFLAHSPHLAAAHTDLHWLKCAPLQAQHHLPISPGKGSQACKVAALIFL